MFHMEALATRLLSAKLTIYQDILWAIFITVNAAGSVSETFAMLIHASLANVTSTGEQELQELVSYIPKFVDELPEIQGICSDKMGNWRRASSRQEQFWVYIVLFWFGLHSVIQNWTTRQVRPNFPT